MNPAFGLVACLFKITSVVCRHENITAGHLLQARAYTEKSSFNIHKMLQQINNERTRQGAKPLRISKRLTQAARTHSKDQYHQRKKVHSGSDGSHVGVRVKRKNYRYSQVAENIHHKPATTEEIMQDFINSPLHYKNMLSTRYADFGAAMYRDYWTQVFANPLKAQKQRSKRKRMRKLP